ncbi:hypothetical protein K438DRAFT_494121 [Mycena galopus ATCC 62051]|nr:hypothetical protein K438DRAFT_494121 [Mycena galopus ATCC 62051]
MSFFNGCSDFRVTGGGFYNVQGNMNIQREGTAYTMNGSQNDGRQYPPNQYPAPTQYPAPNQYAGPPNPQYQYGAPNNQFPPQAYRPLAQNLERSQTLPGTNPQGHSTQNGGRVPQYAIAPPGPQVNPLRAPSLQHTVSAPAPGNEHGRGAQPEAMGVPPHASGLGFSTAE